MDTIRLNTHADRIALFGAPGALDHDFIVSGLHDDLIVHSLKDHGIDKTSDRTVLRFCHDHILRSYDNIHLGTKRHIIQTFKFGTAELYPFGCGHLSVVNVALSDKVRYEYVFRLIVDFFRCADLLDHTVGHDNDFIRHRQCLFLIVCDIDKGNAKFFVHRHQL